MEAAKKDWDTADYRGRREIQEVLKPKLPRGSIAETLRKQAGLAEACSSCDERVTKYRPLVRRRALRRFSGPELRKRVEEALSERAETKKVQDQEEEEEAYMCCVNRGFQALFERIRYSDVPVVQAHLTPVEAELSTQLFYTLVGHSPEHRSGQWPRSVPEAGE